MANNNHFNLSLDTTAPIGGISTGTSDTKYINANFNLSITTGGASYMKVWYNDTGTGTKEDTGYTGGSWIAAAETYETKFTENGQSYYHLVLMDDLGNESVVYNTPLIIFDNTLPIVSKVTITGKIGGSSGTSSTTLTNIREVDVEVVFDYDLAAPIKISISGDYNADATKWSDKENISAAEQSSKKLTRSIVLSGTGEEDVTKTVSFTLTDKAGNVSAAGSGSITLDTKFLKGNITVENTDTPSKTITNTWVNYRAVKVNIELTGDTDIVGYKLWGDINPTGDTPTTEPTSYTSVTGSPSKITITTNLTINDAQKTIQGKIIDDAGNETTLNNVTVGYDVTPPVVSIALASTELHKYVSAVDGYKTKNLTPTIDAGLSGCKSYIWKMNGSEYTGGSGTGTPSTFTVSSENMGEAGNKQFTLFVLDNAGNSTTSSALEVVYDTTPPDCSGITMAAWYNSDAEGTIHDTYSKFSQASATATATDSEAGMNTMQCWTSTTALDTNVQGTEVTYAANPGNSVILWTGCQEGDSNYVHIQYKDRVGNTKIYHSNAFGKDTAAPYGGTIVPQYSVYRTQSSTWTIGCSDAASGVAKMKIWGDIVASAESTTKITETTAAWENFASVKSLILAPNSTSASEETKTIYIKFHDVAGNVSTAFTGTCKLNTSSVTPTISLHKVGGTAMPAQTNVAHIWTRISVPGGTEGIQYKMYGDFTYESQQEQGITEAAAEYKDLVYESGQEYMQLTNVYLTSGEGTKTLYVKIKYTGIESSPASASVVYDVSAPTMTVSNVTYNTISKVHTPRRTSGGEVSGTYNDMTTFTFTPSGTIAAYKVCAFMTQEGAQSTTGDEATAIPTEGGSTNMSATGISSSEPVSCKIMGLDFENALKTNDPSASTWDGLRYVVVYGQDEAGNWSEPAIFTTT